MNQAKAAFMPLPMWLYVVGWAALVYVFISILSFRADNPGNILLAGLYLVEFGVHEVSHIITMVFPPIVTAAAGSFGEVSFVVLMLYAAIKGKAYFAACFVGLWLMLALRSVGLYMSDARSQLLPLIGPGETVQHDWHFVFGELGWLNADKAIGSTVLASGVLIGVLSLLAGLMLIYRKFVQE